MFAIASNVRNALPDTLLGFSPYRNGSYLVELPEGLPEEWKLYCCCGRPAICSCWTWSELKSYAVSNEAYLRGYGSPDEVMPMSRTRGLSFIVRQGGRAGSKANCMDTAAFSFRLAACERVSKASRPQASIDSKWVWVTSYFRDCDELVTQIAHQVPLAIERAQRFIGATSIVITMRYGLTLL